MAASRSCCGCDHSWVVLLLLLLLVLLLL